MVGKRIATLAPMRAGVGVNGMPRGWPATMASLPGLALAPFNIHYTFEDEPSGSEAGRLGRGEGIPLLSGLGELTPPAREPSAVTRRAPAARPGGTARRWHEVPGEDGRDGYRAVPGHSG